MNAQTIHVSTRSLSSYFGHRGARYFKVPLRLRFNGRMRVSLGSLVFPLQKERLPLTKRMSSGGDTHECPSSLTLDLKLTYTQSSSG